MALVLFFILVIILTFPLVFKIATHIPGFFSSDEIYAPIWDAWRAKFSRTNNLPIWKTDLIIYPFGMDFYKDRPISYVWCLINYELAIFTTPVLTYNLQAIVNFLLAAFFTYLLVYRLTGRRLCSILAGIIFGFSPYLFARSWQHLAETYYWTLALFLFTLFKLKDKDTLSTKIWFIVSFALTSINFADTFFASVILSVFLVYILRNWQMNKNYLKKIIILTMITFAILTPVFFLFFKNILFSRNSVPSGYNVYLRPLEDLFSQSAKPLSYLLPAAMHPIFGKFTEQFVGSQLYGVSFTEHTLYLGWTPLILAFIAFRRWRLKRKSSIVHSPQSTEEDFYIGFFVLLAIVAWFFSQPPWWQWGSLKIYMPSFFMYKILPMFRAYCRFGIVVMLVVAVLAGFGLKFILERFKKRKSRLAVTALFCGLVLFEFWNYPPFKVIDVSVIPKAYYWLKDEPGDFAIAEYPLFGHCPIELYKFYQTKHNKKLINGAAPGTYAFKVAKGITKLSEPQTAKILKWMRVRYVFVHREEYIRSDLEEMIEELNNISRNPGLKLVKNFPPQYCPQKDIMCIQKTGPIDVYEVIAHPAKPQVKE